MPWVAAGGPIVGAITQLMQSMKLPSQAPRRRMRDSYRALPVLFTAASFPPFEGKRVALLVNLACNGITGHVTLRGD